jgi:hypothetical protein
VATLNGISRVKRNPDYSYDIFNYTTSHGLPSPDVYQIAELEGKIYAATGNGIIQLDLDIEPQVSTKPIVTKITIGDVVVKKEMLQDLSYNQNTLFIEVLSINYAHAEQMTYRYRRTGTDWVETKERNMLIQDLNPGRYVLEFQS